MVKKAGSVVGEMIVAEYKKLLELNKQLNHELKKGGTSLDRILSESWKLMQSIDRQPPPKKESELQAIHQILAELVELQKENQELIQERMEELSRELSQVKTGKQAQRAYHNKSRDAKFLDQFK